MKRSGNLPLSLRGGWSSPMPGGRSLPAAAPLRCSSMPLQLHCRSPQMIIGGGQHYQQRAWLSTGAGGKRSSKSSGGDFDAKASKKVHILEARDRVLSRLRDKKHDAASGADVPMKFKKKRQDKTAGGAKGEGKAKAAAKPKKGAAAASQASGEVVEVVGDGAASSLSLLGRQARRVAEATTTDASLLAAENEEEAPRELLPPMTLADIVAILREEKGLYPMVIDVSEKCNFAHYMVIIEGRSGRHLRAMAERIMEETQARQRRPEANAGLEVDRDNDDWVVVDTGDILIQLFSPGARRYYDLEGLWTLQKRIGDRSEQDEVVDVEDLDPLPDLDDVPNGWNPWDQTVQRA